MMYDNRLPDALATYVNSLTDVAFDYAGEYADYWVNGGKCPESEYFVGLTDEDAKTIRMHIRSRAKSFAQVQR